MKGNVITLTEEEIPEDLYRLAERGEVWAISRWMSGQKVTSYSGEILLEIQNRAETRQTVKIHQQVYHQSEVEATFTLEYGLQGSLLVLLDIDDEMKVEQLELTDPVGQHNIFSQFDTGLVYFKLTNRSDIGVWSYRVKLYDNIQFPAEGYTVDVSAGVTGEDAVLARADTSVRSSLATLPVTVTGTVERRGHPVISARVEVEVTGPEGFSAQLVLQDGGGGESDVTRHDGVYTGHLPSLAAVPGHYTVRMFVSDSEGLAVAPRNKGDLIIPHTQCTVVVRFLIPLNINQKFPNTSFLPDIMNYTSLSPSYLI